MLFFLCMIHFLNSYSNSPPSPKAESRHHHDVRRAPTLSAGSTFYPASVFLQSEPPPPLEGPDLYGTTGGTSVVPPYSPPVFPGELQRADQG